MTSVSRGRMALAILGVGALGLAASLGAAGSAAAEVAVPEGCTVNGVEGGAPTAGDDVINCVMGVPEEAILRGLGGNDRITVTGEDAESNTSGRAGVHGTVNGGPGDDTITVTGGARSFDSGPAGVRGTVNGGEGNDTITATGGPGWKGDGGDGLRGGTLNGGKGNDKITAAGGKAHRDRPGAGADEGKINGGEGDDTITATGRSGFLDSTVQAGPGNDVIKGLVGARTTVNGGDGDDTCPPKDNGEVINCESTKP